MSRLQTLASTVRRFIKAGDVGVIVLYLTLFSVFLIMSFKNFGDAGVAVIQVEGVEYRYSLAEPQTITFEGPVGETVIEIDEHGHAGFIYSDCRDQICVHQGFLSRGGQWAGCLPNRIILRMEVEAQPEANGQEIDATAF